MFKKALEWTTNQLFLSNMKLQKLHRWAKIGLEQLYVAHGFSGAAGLFFRSELTPRKTVKQRDNS